MTHHKTATADDATLDLIANLYDSVLDPTRWPQVAQGLAGVVPVSQLTIGIFDPSSGHTVFSGLLDAVPEQFELFQRLYSVPATNPLIRLAMKTPVGAPLFANSVGDDQELARTELFQELITPLDYHHMLEVTLLRGHGVEAMFTLYRPRRGQPFEPADFERIRPLIPHLQRVSQLHVRLEAAETRCACSLEVLDRLDFGLLLLDRRGVVVHRNAEAERLARPGLGLTIGRDARLRAEACDADRALQRLVGEACGTGAGLGASAGGELLVRGDGGGALRLVVTPLRGDAAGWEVRGVAAAVMVFDPSRATAPRLDSLRALYGLTHAEAAVVMAIVSGLDTRGTAARQGVEFSTVRSQLYRAMEKLGVRTQPELVGTVLGSFLGAGAASRLRN